MKTTNQTTSHPRRVRTVFALGALALTVAACGGSGGAVDLPKPEFTRLCASGAEASNGACAATTALASNAPACTRDNLTGLVWEARASLAELSPSVPLDRLCDVPNWREPTVHEMLTLDHAGNGDAASIDRAFFPDLGGPNVVLAGEASQGAAGTRWVVGFSGLMAVGTTSDATPRVRWVSGLAVPPLFSNVESQALTAVYNAPGTALVPQNPVVVQRGPLTWLVLKSGSAKSLSNTNVELAAINQISPANSNWRLPTRLELDTLVDRTKQNPGTLNPATHLDSSSIRSDAYWSSSPATAGQTWVVDFSFGGISPKDPLEAAFAIYVRR